MVQLSIPKSLEEEEDKIQLAIPKNVESDVLKGSVINIEEFDDTGNEKKTLFEKTKEVFKKDKEPEFEDPILKAIYDVEKQYSYDNIFEGYYDQVLKKTYAGAAKDVAQSTIDFTNYIAKKFPNVDDNIIDTKLVKIPEPNYFGGTLSRDIIGFIFPYAGITKTGSALKIPEAKSKISKSFRILTKGGLAEQFAFSPYEERLSTLVETYKDGKFSNSVTEFLAAVDTDNEDEARAKMFLEGSLIGIPLEVLGWAVRGGKVKANTANATETSTTKIDTSDIPVIKKLSNENVINLNSNADEITALKNELKELKKIKIPKKIITRTVNGKKVKTTITDESIALDKANKIAVIVNKLKPLEIEETILNNTIKSSDQADINKKLGDKPRTLEGKKLPDEITKPSLNFKINNRVTKAAEELLVSGKVKRNPNIQINEQIADLIFTGRIDDDVFQSILKRNNVSLKEFAKFFSENASDAGRTLNSLSIIQAKINKIDGTTGSNVAWKKALDDGTEDALDKGSAGFLKKLDNVRRGLMVTQIATAMRNFQSQSIRQGLAVLEETFDKALQTLYRVVAPNGKIIRKVDPINAFSGFVNIYRQFNPLYFKKVKRDVSDILSSFPKEEDRLFLRFSSDVVANSKGKGIIKGLEKATNLLNIVNKFQEFITRRSVFQARLNNLILNNPDFYGGKNLKQIINDGQVNIIRKSEVAQAVDAALEITFAKNFNKYKGGYEAFAGSFINFVNKIPFSFSLAIPFPRFMMNSLRFHFDFSPLGFLNFLSRSELSALAKGDTSKISRAVLGTAMLYTAYQIRHKPYAGEKWYELKIGDKTFDTRAYNPFAAYLFVADLVKRHKEGTIRGLDLKGFASVFLGTRAGTGLYLIDKLIDAFSGEKADANPEEIVAQIGGNVLSTFLTPLQTYLDFAAENNPELGIVRTTREDPFYGQIKKKISPEELPPLYSATSIEFTKDGFPVAKTIRREAPRFRQLTGFTIIPEKNAAEKEFDRLGFLPREIFRSTGIYELDKAIKMELAPVIAMGVSNFVESDVYKNLNNTQKTYLLKSILTQVKSDVMQSVRNNTDIVPYILEYDLNNIPNDKKKLIIDALGEDLFKQIKETYLDKNKTKENKVKLKVPESLN